jgi:hypothetical protein
MPSSAELASVAAKKGWVNMGRVEKNKLQWTADHTLQELEDEETRNPIRKSEVRFDLAGRVVPPDADIPVTAGLHHHSEFSEQAGYVLFCAVRLRLPASRCSPPWLDEISPSSSFGGSRIVASPHLFRSTHPMLWCAHVVAVG